MRRNYSWNNSNKPSSLSTEKRCGRMLALSLSTIENKSTQEHFKSEKTGTMTTTTTPTRCCFQAHFYSNQCDQPSEPVSHNSKKKANAVEEEDVSVERAVPRTLAGCHRDATCTSVEGLIKRYSS